eukprot:7242623-Alexandrium_andersonii.AAC.1
MIPELDEPHEKADADCDPERPDRQDPFAHRTVGRHVSTLSGRFQGRLRADCSCRDREHHVDVAVQVAPVRRHV